MGCTRIGPRAGHRRAMAEVLAAFEGNRARIEAERQAAGQPRTVVMG